MDHLVGGFHIVSNRHQRDLSDKDQNIEQKVLIEKKSHCCVSPKKEQAAVTLMCSWRVSCKSEVKKNSLRQGMMSHCRAKLISKITEWETLSGKQAIKIHRGKGAKDIKKQHI